MRVRIKKFIALVVTVLVLNQLPGFDVLVTYAATNELYTNYTLTSDSEYTQVFRSGGVSLTIESGVTVEGVELSTIGNKNTVNNSGTVNSVTVTAGELVLNGGYYGTINLAEGAIMNASSISAGTLTSSGTIDFQGENYANYFSAVYPGGDGTLTVSDELTLQETQVGVTVIVNKDTIINAPTSDLTLYCYGAEYTIPGGTNGITIAEKFGTKVAFETLDGNVSWATEDIDNLSTYLLPEEMTGTYICTAFEGYYFPEDYEPSSDGQGFLDVSRVSDTELKVSYSVFDGDSGTVTITFPDLEKYIVDGEGTFSVADVTYGEIVKPDYTSATQDTENAIVEYKMAGEADEAYTTTVPTAVGTYIARVTIPADDDNYELVMTDDFAITKAAGEGKLTVADVYYGVTVAPELSSGTNSVSGVEVLYKVAGTSDLTYSKTVPTAVGSYVAKVTLPENDTHNSVVLTAEFAIGYMPVPENPYTLVGTQGNNNYYVSSVTVIAKDGYVISRSQNGEYVGQFTIDSTNSGTYVYFMDENTGAKSAGVLMSAINIDTTLPSIDAENKNTYYADSLAVAINDNNLSSITVNGESVNVTQGSTVLELISDGGVEEYQIIVTDVAGNVRNIIVTVAAEWTKTGEIPSGSPVKLKAGQTYTLGSGTWTVNGDSTCYNGGSTFFVGGDGKYTFDQQ